MNLLEVIRTMFFLLSVTACYKPSRKKQNVLGNTCMRSKGERPSQKMADRKRIAAIFKKLAVL